MESSWNENVQRQILMGIGINQQKVQLILAEGNGHCLQKQYR